MALSSQFYPLITLMFAFASLQAHASTIQNVTVKDLRLFYGSQEYFIKGMCYSPSPSSQEISNDMGGTGLCTPRTFVTAGTTNVTSVVSPCYLQDYFDGSHYADGPSGGYWSAIWQRDFPLLKELGVNTLRIYHAYPITQLAVSQNPSLYPSGYVGVNHVPFLDLADSFGFKVIFPLYADEADLSLGPVILQQYIRDIINEVGNHPAVLMYTFGNELQFFSNGAAYQQMIAGYINYARSYQIQRWNRYIPITTALIDIPNLYNNLATLPVDIITTNAGYRGFTFTNLWSGDQSQDFSGMYSLSCQYGKPVLIGEMGVHANTPYFDLYYWFPSMWSDIIAHKTQGAIGGLLFEWSDEHWKGVAPGQTYEMKSDTFMGIVNQTQGAGYNTNPFVVDVVHKKYIGAYNWTSVIAGFAQNPYVGSPQSSLGTAQNTFCAAGSPSSPVSTHSTTSSSLTSATSVASSTTATASSNTATTSSTIAKVASTSATVASSTTGAILSASSSSSTSSNKASSLSASTSASAQASSTNLATTTSSSTKVAASFSSTTKAASTLARTTTTISTSTTTGSSNTCTGCGDSSCCATSNGNACYNAAQYRCINIGGSNVLCGAVTHNNQTYYNGYCNNGCYDVYCYSCSNNALVPSGKC